VFHAEISTSCLELRAGSEAILHWQGSIAVTCEVNVGSVTLALWQRLRDALALLQRLTPSRLVELLENRVVLGLGLWLMIQGLWFSFWGFRIKV